MSYSAVPYSQYLSASTYAKAAIGFLVVTIITDVIGIFVMLGNASVIRSAGGGVVPPADAMAAMDARDVVMGILGGVVFVCTVIAYLMWVHRANRAARSFGVAYMEFTPGWAVGWWFVPIMNLFMPFRALAEIWKASTPRSLDATSWQSERTPPLLLTWWLAYLLHGVVPILFIVSSFTPTPTLEDSLRINTAYIFVNIGSVTAAVLGILVVAGINQWQEQKRYLLQSAAQGGQAAAYPAAYQPAHGTNPYATSASPAGYAPAPQANDPVAHYNRGVGYYQANDMARAIEEYKEAIRLNPNFAEAHYSLGLAYLAMGNRDAASIQASRLQSFSPDYSNRLYQLIRGR